MTGIYMITNKINNKSYIGLSIDIENRIKAHFSRAFTRDREYDKLLYRAIRKHGVESFSWRVLELCEEKELEQKEISWIEKFDTYKNGYNETIGGEIGNMQKGEQHSRSKLTEAEVRDIRTRYNNLERHMEVYEKYKHKIGKSGFGKVWRGESWKHIMMEVYTEENKNFHKNNSAMKGSTNGRAILTEDEVLSIWKRKENGETAKKVYEDYKDRMAFGSFFNTYSGYNWKHLKK